MSRIEEALDRAFQRQLANWRAGGVPPSVASVAAAAGVSRQNVYKSHRSIVDRIRLEVAGVGTPKSVQNLHMLGVVRRALAREKERTKALSRLCAELAAELVETRQEFEHEIAQLRGQLEFVRIQKRKT